MQALQDHERELGIVMQDARHQSRGIARVEVQRRLLEARALERQRPLAAEILGAGHCLLDADVAGRALGDEDRAEVARGDLADLPERGPAAQSGRDLGQGQRGSCRAGSRSSRDRPWRCKPTPERSLGCDGRRSIDTKPRREARPGRNISQPEFTFSYPPLIGARAPPAGAPLPDSGRRRRAFQRPPARPSGGRPAPGSGCHCSECGFMPGSSSCGIVFWRSLLAGAGHRPSKRA